jgi:hypothetical protein
MQSIARKRRQGPTFAADQNIRPFSPQIEIAGKGNTAMVTLYVSFYDV